MWWTKKEKEILDDLYASAIGSDNTDYILEKLSGIYNMIWDKHIATFEYVDMNNGEVLATSCDKRNWELVAVEKSNK